MGFPASSAVTDPADANRFVADRVSEGADYIKVIIEDPGRTGTTTLDVKTIIALVEAAHKVRLKVIAHISSLSALIYVADTGIDIITHAPLDAAVDEDLASSLAKRGIASVPTLTMMYAIAGKAEHLPHGNTLAYAMPDQRCQHSAAQA